MIICHSRKFIFVHIHKTGGTSVERALDPHLAWNDLILGGSPFGEKIQQPYAKKFGLNKHSTVSDIEAVCGDLVRDYVTFALVRNPLSRMCSLYNFVATIVHRWADQQGIDLADVERHITPQAIKKKPALKWSSTKAFLRAGNFSEFIRHKGLMNAPGFRSQLNCLAAGKDGVLKARFFRLEDFPEWMTELNAITGVELILSRENESDLKLQDDATVTAEDHSHIRSLFQQDYEAFGYDT
jgi:hypothetical protein